jgi:hypothetical protein
MEASIPEEVNMQAAVVAFIVHLITGGKHGPAECQVTNRNGKGGSVQQLAADRFEWRYESGDTLACSAEGLERGTSSTDRHQPLWM